MTDLSQNSNEVERLRERIAHLELQNRILVSAPQPPIFPRHWKLNAGQARLLNCLLATGYADKSTLLSACRVKERTTDRIVNTLVAQVRKKLNAAGVLGGIRVVRTQGYELIGLEAVRQACGWYDRVENK